MCIRDRAGQKVSVVETFAAELKAGGWERVAGVAETLAAVRVAERAAADARTALDSEVAALAHAAVRRGAPPLAVKAAGPGAQQIPPAPAFPPMPAAGAAAARGKTAFASPGAGGFASYADTELKWSTGSAAGALSAVYSPLCSPPPVPSPPAAPVTEPRRPAWIETTATPWSAPPRPTAPMWVDDDAPPPSPVYDAAEEEGIYQAWARSPSVGVALRTSALERRAAARQIKMRIGKCREPRPKPLRLHTVTAWRNG